MCFSCLWWELNSANCFSKTRNHAPPPGVHFQLSTSFKTSACRGSPVPPHTEGRAGYVTRGSRLAMKRKSCFFFQAQRVCYSSGDGCLRTLGRPWARKLRIYTSEAGNSLTLRRSWPQFLLIYGLWRESMHIYVYYSPLPYPSGNISYAFLHVFLLLACSWHPGK